MASGNTDNEHELLDEQEAESDPTLPLVRTSSIYTLTLNELQNTVCEPGRPFGSMNMDEFLSNIWNAEEGQVAEVVTPNAAECVAGSAGLQPLRRQASMSLPGPLGRRTVDEVWTEIHCNGGNVPTSGGDQMPQHPVHANNTTDATRQMTFGEMTLEEFLVKAGVVREGVDGSAAVMPFAPQHLSQVMPVTPQYNMAGYQLPATMSEVCAGFGHYAGGSGYGNGAGYEMRNGYGSNMGNGHGQVVMAGSPSSPGSHEEIADKTETSGKNVSYRAARGTRRREADKSGLEKVVERRERRMIKNRESAARSRARKQAYTVELETELNQLKEANARLQEEQERVLKMSKKMLEDDMDERSQTNLGKRMRALRRCSTACW